MKEIAFGYCHCGCGIKTPLSTRTRSDIGLVKGEPLKFIRGHIGRLNSINAYENKIIREDDRILKLCTLCNFHKEISPQPAFSRSKSSQDKFRSWCKDCEKIKASEFYHANSEPYKKRARIYQKQLRIELYERMFRIKQKYGCGYCKENEVACLDFHHYFDKDRNLGNATDSLTRFEKELVKCVVVCANCHRKIHAGILEVTPDMLCKKDDGVNS